MSAYQKDAGVLSDSSDNEVFVLKQIKPVNKLTLQQALLIKHGVLSSFQLKSESKKKKKKAERPKADNNEAKSKKESGKTISDKTSKNKSTKPSRGRKEIKKNLAENKRNDIKGEVQLDSSSEKINNSQESVDVFSVFKLTPEKAIKSEKGSEEKIQLSPGISRKRKKFNISSPNSPKGKKIHKKRLIDTCDMFQGKKNLLTMFDDEAPDGHGECKAMENDGLQIDDYITLLNSYKDEEKKCMNNSELLSVFLKKIIQNEIKKQINLRVNLSKSGRTVEKLLTEKDCEIFEKFFKLDENACKIFVRMLCRKKDWHRVLLINYSDISENLTDEFVILTNEGFVDSNIEDEDISIQLNLLSRTEVTLLCKTFNVPIKANGPNKKKDLINLLIESTKTQKSVLDMIKKSKTTVRFTMLKTEIKKSLGMCVRLNSEALAAFSKVVLLFSFPHYFEEEDKRFSSQLFLCLKILKMGMRFPSYKLSPTVVFETCEDFEMYQNALQLKDSFETAITNKRHEEFQTVANIAKDELIRLLDDKDYQRRFLNLEPHLRKFSAGSIYSRILTRYCKVFKKNSDAKEIVEICRLLLGQDLFITSKKGEWYEILAKALESLKDNNSAAEVIIQALKDTTVDEVQKVTLQLRGQLILRKKTNLVNDGCIREVLDDLCTLSVQEPSSIEITGKPVQDNKQGFKSIYVEESANGKMYTSVEERAISYYRSLGFTNGFHVEGFIVQSIYFLLFFDVIYGVSPPGVFQSSYQEAPLDLNSKYFYLNRKDYIDSLIQQISSWTISDVETKLKDIYAANYETNCVLSWKEHFTPELFCDFIQCLTMPVMALICQRFAQNFRVSRSGFPDLTLWNSRTKKCKFVEVKSPNDKLSPAQRVWLDYLRRIGVDCEVCNVKNISSKIFS